jgi:hypothetical protein
MSVFFNINALKMIATAPMYNEISEFIASINPEKVIAFRPSVPQQERLDMLLDKQREEGLNLEEQSEVQHYLIINRIIGLAKARALKMMRL